LQGKSLAGQPAVLNCIEFLDQWEPISYLSLARRHRAKETQRWRVTAGKGDQVKLIKMFGLAAVAAVAAMAFMGASSAMAKESTTLCKVHQEPCEAKNIPAKLHMVTVGEPELLSSIAVVACLSSLAEGTVGALGTAPTAQRITITTLTWTGCYRLGGEEVHGECSVVNLKLPVFDLLKTALNLGEATALGAEVLVSCPGFIHCVYGGPEVKGFSVEGALHSKEAGHGHFTANALSVPKVKGFLCPETSKWDALYENLEHLYVVS
jgi:hypothetical protein